MHLHRPLCGDKVAEPEKWIGSSRALPKCPVSKVSSPQMRPGVFPGQLTHSETSPIMTAYA